MNHFERCRPWLEAALEYGLGCHTIDDVQAGIEAGKFQLWPGEKCAAVTEVQEFPRAKFFNVFLAGGDLDEIRNMVPWFQSFGRHMGCTKLTATGREGWARALRSQGWEKAKLVYLSLPIDGQKTEGHA